MRVFLAATIVAQCCFLASFVSADDASVIEPIAPEDMKFFLGDIGKVTFIDGVDGKRAARVEVPVQGEKNWDVLHHSPKNTKPIRKGDIVVTKLTLRVTGDPADVGIVGVYSESAVKEKSGSVGGAIHPTTELQTFRRSVVSPGDFEPGEFIVSVHLAAKAQTVEIYDVAMEVYPAGTSKEELKIDGITWEGREKNAAWRTAANDRIERLRKGDLEIRVVDADGQPVAGATVRVRQQRHAWRFGTFVGGTLLADSPDGEKYREMILSRYNFLTLPAYLADWGWRSDDARLRYFRYADWAQQNNMPARGHLLVYPGWTATPGEWFELPKPELRARLEAHIPRAIRTFKQRGVTEWDVTNELRYNKYFMDEIGGVEVAADWFKMAREELPDGQLYLNETIILPNDGHTETEQSTLEQQLQLLIDQGAPIDGIGLQGHFRSEMTSPTRVLEILDRFAKFERDIMITEFDMDNDDKQAQAAYLVDFYTACFSHPRVRGIVQWGFWEKEMWQPRGHHFTKDWTETPLAKAYHDLVYRKWWTNESGTTDQSGQFENRPFQGVHRVAVRHGDYEWTGDVTVTAYGTTLDVVVP